MARLSKRQRAILDAKEAAAAEAEPAGQDGQPLATLGPAVEDDDDGGGDGPSLDEALAPQIGGDPETAKAVQKATILEKIGTNVDKVEDESFKERWEKKMNDLLDSV